MTSAVLHHGATFWNSPRRCTEFKCFLELCRPTSHSGGEILWLKIWEQKVTDSPSPQGVYTLPWRESNIRQIYIMSPNSSKNNMNIIWDLKGTDNENVGKYFSEEIAFS